MARIKEKISLQSYEIYIGCKFLNNIAEDLVQSLKENTTVYIISDEQVGHLYGERLKNDFHLLQIPCKVIIQSETNITNIGTEKIEKDLGDSFIVSLGSSSICKFSRILAATFKHCIGIAFIPTTLRGCVDLHVEDTFESIQCKDGQAKNVYINLEILRTLPRRHFVNGMSEIIKIAIILSSGWRKWTDLLLMTDNIADDFKEIISLNQNDLLDFLELNANLLISAQEDVIVEVVTRTLRIKSQIFGLALRNNNSQILSVLRLGNSIGEAIKATSQELLYGECLAIGMVKEAAIFGEDIISFSTVGRLVRCLKRFELPTRIPNNMRANDILAKMKTLPENVTMDSIKFVLEKQISIVPSHGVSGTLRVPGSKSVSNRVLLMAAMGYGTCHISGMLHSDDTQVMINALERIGANFEWIGNDEILVVHGAGGRFRITDSDQEIFINHSGTAARFLTSFLTLVKGETDKPIILTGSTRMKERPIGPLVDSLRTNGCNIKYLEKEGCLPLVVNYTGLEGGIVRMASKISSTFVTSVLISAPYASTPMIIELEEEKPTSLTYILMTMAIMAKFNVHIKREGLNRFVVPCGVYENPSHIEIEVDASSATYPLSMAAVTGGTVCILGLGQQSLQGDAKFYTLLEKMGCTAWQSDAFTRVTGPPNGMLQAVSINMESMTDAFMSAIAVGAVSCGTTQITGISNQRVKESNRIAVMVNELQKIGIPSGELEDGMWVEGIGNWSQEERKQKLKTAFISCHNDHRIAMSFAVLGCVLDQIIITNKECTEKTYPSFWDDCRNKLGLLIQPNSIYDRESMDKSTIDNDAPPCIVIIGMRGCGKSALGLKASQTFSLKFIDMDILFEEKFQEPLTDFVSKYGWKQFRHRESQLLQQLMTEKSSGTIICCGGGVVESESARMLLKNYFYVIYIERDLEAIISNLNQEFNPRRGNLNEPVEITYRRRLPWYEECSSIKFVINSDEKNLNQIHFNFEKFLRNVIPNIPVV